jgi:hypothetical protein
MLAMSRPQQIVLGLGFLLVLVMVLFPPWIFVYHYEPRNVRVSYEQRIERPAGYHAIWESHVPSDSTALGSLFSLSTSQFEQDRLDLKYFSMRLDKDRLWIQLAGVTIATLLLTALLYKRPR